MMALQAGPEGTALQIYRRYHTVVVWAVLSVTGVATGVTAALALMQALVFANALMIGASVVLALFAVYSLLRHWGLAVLTVVAPLPGLMWAAPIASGSDFGSVPFLAYGLAAATATLYGEHKLTALLQPDSVLPAGLFRWMAGPFLPVLAAVGMMVLLALLWFHSGPAADAALQATADTVLAHLSVLLFLPLSISLLHFDEAFVARANRASEQRGRWLEGLSFAAIPRWGLSLAGITVVLIVLGWYGARGQLRDAMLLRTASVLLVAVLGGLIGAGWREGLAVVAAVGWTCLLTLWATLIATGFPNGGVAVLQTAGLAAMLALYSLWRERQYQQWREAARERVLADCGGPLVAMLACAAALIPLLVIQSAAAVMLIGVGFAGLAGVLLTPAVVTGLEAFFPRRATVEELYGRGARKR